MHHPNASFTSASASQPLTAPWPPFSSLVRLPRTSNEIIKSLRSGGRLTRPPPLLKLAPIIEIQTTGYPRVSARSGRPTDSPLDIRWQWIVAERSGRGTKTNGRYRVEIDR